MATIPASENVFPEVLLAEVAAPAAAPSGQVRLYVKADGLLYWKDDAGTEYAVGQGDTAGHLADTTDAHDASAVSFDPTGLAIVAGTEVQTAIEELDAAVDAVGGAAYGSASHMRTAGDYTIASATFADVDGTNFSHTITTGARRVLVTFSGTIQSSVAGDQFALDVLLDGVSISGGTSGFVFGTMLTTANRGVNASFSFITAAMSAGSHTFKLQWRRALGSGTLTMFGSSTAVAVFSVAELP